MVLLCCFCAREFRDFEGIERFFDGNFVSIAVEIWFVIICVGLCPHGSCFKPQFLALLGI